MCEAIGEARRHRPCLRGTAFEVCSSALMVFLRFRCKGEESAAPASRRRECMPGDGGTCGDASKRRHGSRNAPRGDDSPDDSQLHSPQTQTRDHRPIHRDRHADMDLSATYMIWRSDVICCKTPETTPPRAEPCEAQSGALWTLQSADSHHLDSACSVCLRKGYWDQTATISR